VEGAPIPTISAGPVLHHMDVCCPSCPTATPTPHLATHLKSEVGRSNVILPSGLGYSRGEKLAAGRSRSWSPYLCSSGNRGRQKVAP
jgi:hypothetical protein